MANVEFVVCKLLDDTSSLSKLFDVTEVIVTLDEIILDAVIFVKKEFDDVKLVVFISDRIAECE